MCLPKRKCDRCGVEFNNDDTDNRLLRLTHTDGCGAWVHDFDLCPECYRLVYAVIASHENCIFNKIDEETEGEGRKKK